MWEWELFQGKGVPAHVSRSPDGYGVPHHGAVRASEALCPPGELSPMGDLARPLRAGPATVTTRASDGPGTNTGASDGPGCPLEMSGGRPAKAGRPLIRGSAGQDDARWHKAATTPRPCGAHTRGAASLRNRSPVATRGLIQTLSPRCDISGTFGHRAILRRSAGLVSGSAGRVGVIAPGTGGPNQLRVGGGHGTVLVADSRRFLAGCEPARRPAAQALRQELPALPAALVRTPCVVDGDPVQLHASRVPDGTDKEAGGPAGARAARVYAGQRVRERETLSIRGRGGRKESFQRG